ncbi:type IV toxin-antitoxin system AbiEi family antitoxin domain-containing protein [Auraticoccus monumenti]|uniref:Transcriptional regulator, AbiEi antitoxin, Type IV TA system n=1 Tax=Auraticoccus monumenti TaxID=675864 RepID=A0A1G7EUD4_9ACTN|nr:type IV toxin-antitoxin system AbiEi family antitoxin domain-containing protein [Auraticoccus monumenti]SDE67310.1 hypothetical protein SAMN04489747_4048 [Auraticoccus monumenti]
MRSRHDPPDALLFLASLQGGVLTPEQLQGHGLSRRPVDRLVSQRHWSRPVRGIVCTSGQASWLGMAWAGVLLGPEGSRVGGQAGLHLHGLSGEPEQIDVWTPRGRRLRVEGPYRFREEGPATHSGRTFGSPPHLGVEDCVLDLAAELDQEDFLALVIDAVQRRRTTPSRLCSALACRPRARHRALLEAVLGDVRAGVESPLERAYLHRVERAHGLPRGRRQVRRGGYRRDVVHEELGLVVELDSQWHAGLARFVDMDRDNTAMLGGLVTLRYGWVHVAGAACRTAAQVAQVMRARGWSGTPTRCRSCVAVPDGDLWAA